MKRWRLIAGILLVFILGLVAGSWGTGMFLRHRMDRFQERPEARKASILERFNRRLELTEAQKTEFEKIINQTEQKVQISRKKHESEMRQLFEESFAQMGRVLTPEQQDKLNQLRQELERRRKEWEEKPGGKDRMPPPPPPPPPMD